MSRAYAIGDIHGHLDLLCAAHRRIAADCARTGDKSAPIIHLGDLVDRGPESAEVIEYLFAGPAHGQPPWLTVKGNHDNMFRLFLKSPPERDPRLRSGYGWLNDNLGGRTTLASYGVDVSPGRPEEEIAREAQSRVPAHHLAFIDAMPANVQAASALFVHAGIRPGVPIEEQTPEDLMWIRQEFHDDQRDHGQLVVHGHTPVEAATHYGNRVNLDTAAAYGGPLTAAVIEDGEVWLITEDGRVPLRP